MRPRLRHALLVVAVLFSTPALHRAAEPAPPATGSFLERANSAASRGAWKEVEAIALEWEQREPGESLPPLALAQALGPQGRFADAAAAARRSLERGETAAARFFLGIALNQLGEWKAAERELARSVEL